MPGLQLFFTNCISIFISNSSCMELLMYSMERRRHHSQLESATLYKALLSELSPALLADCIKHLCLDGKTETSTLPRDRMTVPYYLLPAWPLLQSDLTLPSLLLVHLPLSPAPHHIQNTTANLAILIIHILTAMELSEPSLCYLITLVLACN